MKEHKYTDEIDKSITAITKVLEKKGYGNDFTMGAYSPGYLKDVFRKAMENYGPESSIQRFFPCQPMIEIKLDKNTNECHLCAFTLDWSEKKGIHITHQEIENHTDGQVNMDFRTTITCEADILCLNDAIKVAIRPITEPPSDGQNTSPNIQDHFLQINNSIIAKGFNKFMALPRESNISPEYRGPFSNKIIECPEINSFLADIDTPGNDHLPLYMQTITHKEKGNSTYTLCTFTLDRDKNRPYIEALTIEKRSSKGDLISEIYLPIKSLDQVPTREQVNQMMRNSSKRHKQDTRIKR